MSRISREQAFMETAHVWAKRSTCARLNVGAVVVVNKRIVSHGYNGHDPGADHCSLNSCPGMTPGGCGTTHAEVNALREVPGSLRYSLKHLYVTDSPCMHCVEYMIAPRHNLCRVVFETPYRDTTPLDYLLDRGIEVFRLTPAGYMMDWRNREIVNAN